MQEKELSYDLDMILAVLENPIRRRILKKLAHENNYPLQLSKELNVSQQAVMKHLKVLEESDFVVSYEERSNRGGPPKRVFTPRKRYCIRIDIGPNTYNEEIRSYKNYEIPKDAENGLEIPRDTAIMVSGKVTGEMRSEVAPALPAFIDPLLERARLELEKTIRMEDGADKFRLLSNLVLSLNEGISNIEDKRRRFLTLRDRAYEEVNDIVNGFSDEQLIKDVLMVYFRERDVDNKELAFRFKIDQKDLERIMRYLKKKYSINW